jgi:hypothetical protein
MAFPVAAAKPSVGPKPFGGVPAGPAAAPGLGGKKKKKHGSPALAGLKQASAPKQSDDSSEQGF